MGLKFLFVLLCFILISNSHAQNHYVVAPNTLRLNTDEIIGIAADGNSGGLVKIFVQDVPGRIKNISTVTLLIQSGAPQLFKIRLDENDFPRHFLDSPGYPKFVSLNAHFRNFRKEILIPISNYSGYVFIQTDKPVYTPKERVSIRIIPLSEDLTPSHGMVRLQIKNPNNTIVEQKTFDKRDRQSDKAFESHIFKFPSYPTYGEWSATVLYGLNFKQSSSVRFDLEEYVLPTFTVDLQTPDVILPTDRNLVNIKVSAKYVYGKKVKGLVSFRLGVKQFPTFELKIFAVISPKQLEDGSYNLRITLDNSINDETIPWFPVIDGSHLFVEATVVDSATGNEEMAVDEKCRFSKTPFLISFQRCLTDFKPGRTSVVEADITFANGEPAVGIRTEIRAIADNGKQLNILQNTSISDDEGKLAFEITPETDQKAIYVTLKTVDQNYQGMQTEAQFHQLAFKSEIDSYVTLERNIPQRLKPGDTFGRNVYLEPAEMRNIYYIIAAKGKILKMEKLPDGEFLSPRNLIFQITYEMVPNFRIIVFAHHNNKLLVDSLKIDVENVCDPDAEVSIEPQFNVKEPGNNGKIVIRGMRGTYVGVLGVDEAVYALSKKDLLTRKKIFESLSNHDLGCGAGGGLTTADILGKAGIILGSNMFSQDPSYSCRGKQRRKRDVHMDIVDMYSGIEKECCALGVEQDKHHRNCEERKEIVDHFLKEDLVNCSVVFIECCKYAERNRLLQTEYSRITALDLGRSSDDIWDLINDPDLQDTFEKKTTVRSNFQETWLFEEFQIGVDGKEEIRATLPHSITTWVIQAVSVSPANGICVANPKRLESFQNIFLHLSLPYSVVRNEQIEIQATIFNYGDKSLQGVVYMYGEDGLCSGTQPGKKSEKKAISVDGQSTATVTFPVIPLKAEVIPIRVVAVTTKGTDIIVKELNVVPEGVTEEVDIFVKLDPTNLQRRERRSVETSLYTDKLDPTQNLQVTSIVLGLPENCVPGTESCSISAIGDLLGPAVQTAIQNPESLLDLPHGCGEQNMMRLAPTLYAMRYLKVTGKLTAEIEETGYQFMRTGYGNQLKFRKDDGSYAAFTHRETNTWLTAFVAKVFCEATELIYIDEQILCSSISWLINNQQEDGSYEEIYPLIDPKLMGGLEGKVPLTAFILIALQECRCEVEALNAAKIKAISYVENNYRRVNSPLSAAIVAYALALSGSEKMSDANDKLLRMARYEEGPNWLYWTTDNSAHDIQTSSYALLTQLLFNDMERSTSIVNWLNTKQLQSGAYESTQDTVVALQAMSEYAIRASMPSINLVANISSSNDRYFQETLAFNDQNALVLQNIKLNRKIGGNLFINTAGQGMGSLSVKLRYNVIHPPEDICKFDISVNVTDAQYEDIINELRKELNSDQRKTATQKDDNKKLKYRISLCVRYLGNSDTGMSIVDVGIFSGFAPIKEDIQKIESTHPQPIQKIEKTNKGVIFYLEKIPATHKYCFSFRVMREYIIGNTQMSYIKVYDYYNPDATCTKSYKPLSNSPIIRTLCDGGICQCAEGGCPPKVPFADIKDEQINQRRETMLNLFCEEYDYAWMGRLDSVQTEGGFFNISFKIEKVIKEATTMKPGSVTSMYNFDGNMQDIAATNVFNVPQPPLVNTVTPQTILELGNHPSTNHIQCCFTFGNLTGTEFNKLVHCWDFRIERSYAIANEKRTLIARDNCKTARLFSGVTYLILGKDGQSYMDKDRNIWYRYILDQTSVVYMWSHLSKRAKDPILQRDLNHVTKKIEKEGCAL